MTRIITDLLDKSANEWPDKAAFAEENRTVTFSELKTSSLRIAHCIIQTGVFRKPVAVFLDKGIGCIEAFLGIAYSGNFYTMIDTAMPLQRIEKILDTLQPAVIITDYEHLRQAKQSRGSAEILLLEDTAESEYNEEEIRSVTSQVMDSDVLYVLFTSGSTGVPKGVITSHRAVLGYLDAVTDVYHMDENTVIGNQAPFYFVLSLIDIYCTIRNGGTTWLIPHSYFTFPGKLVRYIEKNQITFLNWVSSALSTVAKLKAFSKADLSCVKTVIFGGEVMPIKHLNAWMDALPNTEFINGYGSTEVTDSATYYVVDRRFKDTDLLPLGKALPNSAILILNENNEPADRNEIGELCVRGNSLSYGYYHDEERTKSVFVQNPMVDAYREIIYKTGDLVQFNEYDEIAYVGRKDFQIKHMGHRIELGEIEVNISSVGGVDEVCCVYDTEKQRIVLFYTGSADPDDLEKEIRLLLPAYMVPNKRQRLEKMPHNLNGKIDRAALKEMAGKL